MLLKTGHTPWMIWLDYAWPMWSHKGSRPDTSHAFKICRSFTCTAMHDRGPCQLLALQQSTQLPDGCSGLWNTMIWPGMILIVRHFPPISWLRNCYEEFAHGDIGIDFSLAHWLDQDLAKPVWHPQLTWHSKTKTLNDLDRRQQQALDACKCWKIKTCWKQLAALTYCGKVFMERSVLRKSSDMSWKDEPLKS